jgi:hypothetical protein
VDADHEPKTETEKPKTHAESSASVTMNVPSPAWLERVFMPLIHRVRPLSFARTAQILALGLGLAPALTFAQQPRPYDDLPGPVSTARSEPWTDTIPAHLAIVDGEAWLERDGDVERAEENLALLAGDRLRTIGGRVEVLFADGSVLDIDRGSTVALLSESLLGLERGQIRLALSRAAGGVDYRVDGAGASAWIRSAGEYRLAVLDADAPNAQLRLTVMRGQAELASPHGRAVVQTGYEAVTAANTLPSHPYVVSVAINDPFERWAYDLRAERLGVTSARYLPEPITVYSGVLDRYGAWQYEQPYGYVWFPRVAPAWRPYHDGRWSFSASFGWIWVGGSRWSWPTHHFGRWGFARSRWFWIPNRHWGPAWVSWVHAPGFVGWCPLGFNNRPVISITNITVFNSHSWRGWTILSSRHFVRNVAVRDYALTSPAALPPVARFAAVRTPDRPASGRVAAARRPLGAPTSVAAATATSSRASSAVAAGRTTAGQTPSASRSAGGRSAPGLSRPPVAESNRTAARAPAARAARPAASAPIDRAGESPTARRAAPRRAAAGTAAIATPGNGGDRADREVGLARGRATRSPATNEAEDSGRARAVAAPNPAAPRRAAPSAWSAPARGAEPEADAPRRAEPAGRSRADRPVSVWSPPASRGGDRRAAPAGRAEPPPAASAAGQASAPASRSRGRSAPAVSAPPSSGPPSRAARPAESAPSDNGGPSRSRAGSRSDSGGESSGARRRAGSRP